jgi:hypothetical protein
MTINVLLPNQKTFQAWIADLNRTIPNIIVPIPPINTKNWHEFAMLLLSINKQYIKNVVLPLKENFPHENDWKKWAYFFIQNV